MHLRLFFDSKLQLYIYAKDIYFVNDGILFNQNGLPFLFFPKWISLLFYISFLENFYYWLCVPSKPCAICQVNNSKVSQFKSES